MIGPVKKPLNLLFRASSPKLKMAFNHLSEIFYFSISVALLWLLIIAYLHGDVLFWWWCCLFVFFFEVGGGGGWLIQDGNYNATATMWKASCNLLGKISNFIRSLNDLKYWLPQLATPWQSWDIFFKKVCSRVMRMDFSYPDDSYPGLDVSYPHSTSSYPTLWTIHTQQITTQNVQNKHKHLLYLSSNRKTVKMHARTRKAYVWFYFLYCWTLLNKKV